MYPGQTVLKIFGQIAQNLDEIATEIDQNVLAPLNKSLPNSLTASEDECIGII